MGILSYGPLGGPVVPKGLNENKFNKKNLVILEIHQFYCQGRVLCKKVQNAVFWTSFIPFNLFGTIDFIFKGK